MSRAPCKYGRVSVQTNSSVLAGLLRCRDCADEELVRPAVGQDPGAVRDQLGGVSPERRRRLAIAGVDSRGRRRHRVNKLRSTGRRGRLLEHRQHRRHDVANVVVGRASGGQQRPRCAQCVGRRVGRLAARRPRRDDETGARREHRSRALRHHVADRRRHVDDRGAVHPAYLMRVDAAIEDVDATAIGLVAQPHRIGQQRDGGRRHASDATGASARPSRCSATHFAEHAGARVDDRWPVER